MVLWADESPDVMPVESCCAKYQEDGVAEKPE